MAGCFFTIKRGDFSLERFIFLFHSSKVVSCEIQAFPDAFRCQKISDLLELGLHTLSAVKVSKLDQPFVGQCLDQVIGLAHAYSQPIRQLPLGNLRFVADNLEDADVGLFLWRHAEPVLMFNSYLGEGPSHDEWRG